MSKEIFEIGDEDKEGSSEIKTEFVSSLLGWNYENKLLKLFLSGEDNGNSSYFELMLLIGTVVITLKQNNATGNLGF